MSQIFSPNQKNALNFIWILILIIATFDISNYFVNNYSPDTTAYTYVSRIQNWLIYSTFFAWYFYRNRKIIHGILIQLLFIPYYIFKNDWSVLGDYYLDFDNSQHIYNFVRFITFIIPITYFSIAYFKNEAFSNSLSKKKKFFIHLGLTLVLSYVVETDVDEFYKYVAFASDSLYTQDMIVSVILLLISTKSVFSLIGFFYISNRIYSKQALKNPLDIQNISSNFFKWGFAISYTLFVFSIIDLGSNAFRISFFSSNIKLTGILYLLSSFFVVFISGRFFAQLIQYRNYSLKKYFGVINSLSVLPLFNLIPFLTLVISRKSQKTIENYILTLKKKRNIHLSIYCGLIILFICYGYFSSDSEYRDTSTFFQIPMMIGAVILLSRYRVMTKVVPFVLVLIGYFEDIKELFDFTKGILFFIEENMLSFIWLGAVSVFLLYYIIYYTIHKSFYTEYFEDQDESEFEENIKQFQ
jgi:hypothetical protein